ncbi:GNAT family N-acetyltransferase [Thalassotalea sp. PLHSN55]|uniref:GNAT family N-acetyltransferase n=1 Tax=Thalassotalea sp. PLHSN55 TaxID=3435888 RepID=UPI003F860366
MTHHSCPKITLSHNSPSVEDFCQLRSQMGWNNICPELTAQSLKNTRFHVTAYHDKKLVGMGRVIGDGAMYFYIQDVIVSQDYQQQGLGKKLMTAIEAYIQAHAVKGATVGLLAAKGKEAFYQQFGYQLRPNDALGHGMCKFI